MTGQVKTFSGYKVYIAPSAAAEPANAAAYAALTWTEIGMVRSVPERGDNAAIIEAAVVGDDRVRKAKGALNAPNGTLTLYPDSADTGQIALLAAVLTKSYYPLKILRNDRLTGGGTDGIDYMWALIGGGSDSGGENDAIVMRSFTIVSNAKVTRVDAA